MNSDLCVFSCDYGLNSHEMFRLIMSCRKVGVDLHVYGEGKWPGWAKAKITGALNFIRSHDNPYFLYTDGYDSFLMRDTEYIMQTFKKINRPILVQAEKNCWPDADKADLYPTCATPWKFLCAGGWIGAREPLIAALGQLEQSQYFDTQDDQRCWTDFFLHDPIGASWVELDHHCEIFQTMFMTSDEEISTTGQNLVTGTYPAIIHFNGNRIRLNDYYERLTGMPLLQNNPATIVDTVV